MSLLTNKKAHYDYQILSKIEAGVVLSGAEVKSLRQKSGSLTGSFVQIVDGEPVLLNAQISPYQFADNRDYDPKRTRKLLLKKSQIYDLVDKVNQKGYTLVPLDFHLCKKKIKLTIGLGKGKKQFEKRAKIRERDLLRESQRQDY